MSERELILLSPYRVPSQHAQTLAGDDVAAFLNGYSALWHPAALRGAAGPPRVASPYDHEQPTPGHVYAVPDNPPLILPDDWDQRVREVGASVFRSTADRALTLANLKEALPATGPGPDPWSWTLEQVGPFLGIGFGVLHVVALFEAMEHENLLSSADLWKDVQQALAALDQGDAEACRRQLQSAADRLLAAREVLYPVTLHLVDMCLLDERLLDQPLPASFDRGFALNLVAASATLEQLGRDHPERMAALRERFQNEQVEVCGGCHLEREDPLLPLESQLWNLRHGLAVARDLLGKDIRVFGRKRFGFHPQLPLFLNNVGLQRALLVSFDDAVLPAFSATVVNWPSPDGKQVEGFTRAPYKADDPLTFFHVAHYLHKTIRQDHAATFALLHTGKQAAPWYEDWLELSRFGPVLGQWTTLSRYFNDVLAGQQASSSSADEYHADFLSERTDQGMDRPVSGFANQVRLRRRIDTAWTLAAIQRGLAGANDRLNLDDRLTEIETKIETGQEATMELDEVHQTVTVALAERLLARAPANNPGFLVLNPCSFARRVALDLDGISSPLPITGPLKACQIDGDKARLVLEVPGLGFAWFPRNAPRGTPAQASRLRLADDRHVRNEFFEAEIDPMTGGLRGLWDHRTRGNRLGQQLVFNPGSTMLAKEVKVTSTGPALGEVISEGALLDAQEQVLATFRQRFRAWLGRPVLELRIEIYPEHRPEGYPWHAYYGARFAWRDERALLLRGVNGTGYVTSHTRPETPDYLELRQGKQNTLLFPGGLPFHQRHGARMLDVILQPPGETARAFELALALDRPHPMQMALGTVTPVPLLPVSKGPPPLGPEATSPHVSVSGWLFHLDATNLLLTSMRPGPGQADALTARLLECGYHGGPAELRCTRTPRRAVLLDARGEPLMEAGINGDATEFEVVQGDLVQLRVEFS